MGLNSTAKWLGCDNAFIWNMKRHNEDYLVQHKEQHNIAFITQRLENMAAHHQALKQLVGEQGAINILAEVLEQSC